MADNGVEVEVVRNPWVSLALQDSAFFQWSSSVAKPVRLRRDSDFDIMDKTLQSHARYTPETEPETELDFPLVFRHPKHRASRLTDDSDDANELALPVNAPIHPLLGRLDLDSVLGALPKAHCMSVDLRRRLAVYFCGHPNVETVVQLIEAGSIEAQLGFLCDLFCLRRPSTFDAPPACDLVRFRRWTPVLRTQKRICFQLQTARPSVRNIHILRQLLAAGLYLVQRHCRLSLEAEPSLGHLCLLLKETRMIYVNKVIAEVDFVSLLRQVFHHGIFLWPRAVPRKRAMTATTCADPIAVYLASQSSSLSIA
ncbi:hypothetical protein SPRG_12783 [Saprolegnia parasitica CBS 223.65]|uniref:Uncharacterized protein n=1 Tax=Saprolegnia parasitica (strain CBS 223.65) TaxID=695850 RepID=A0A067BVN1_SAPPC|nr:hypothetical protein SPRG_12783 [Saprolegnia parasitica CBS 223.65]KDO22323.1 hypothetical protein SPRG_12783 [Saprolegnia parasitica CBS 223.65]|eukprot:XP_012206957.1 hypothetical protein SPRG_12783 [Saprolegnia parasitica CBS 223.65]